MELMSGANDIIDSRFLIVNKGQYSPLVFLRYSVFQVSTSRSKSYLDLLSFSLSLKPVILMFHSSSTLPPKQKCQ